MVGRGKWGGWAARLLVLLEEQGRVCGGKEARAVDAHAPRVCVRGMCGVCVWGGGGGLCVWVGGQGH